MSKQEPSIDEILGDIRRIIGEDEKVGVDAQTSDELRTKLSSYSQSNNHNKSTYSYFLVGVLIGFLFGTFHTSYYILPKRIDIAVQKAEASFKIEAFKSKIKSWQRDPQHTKDYKPLSSKEKEALADKARQDALNKIYEPYCNTPERVKRYRVLCDKRKE